MLNDFLKALLVPPFDTVWVGINGGRAGLRWMEGQRDEDQHDICLCYSVHKCADLVYAPTPYSMFSGMQVNNNTSKAHYEANW